jgi:hypothetical protein
MYKPEARDMSPASVQEYILSKCKQLVPFFDPNETFHAFAGARAKNSRGDWIIEVCETCPQMIHVAGMIVQDWQAVLPLLSKWYASCNNKPG